MRSASTLILISAGLLGLLSGCASPCGTWHPVSVAPQQAQQSFNVQNLRLASDGRYAMDVLRNGQSQHMAGEYTYSPRHETLEFRDDSGIVQAYHAKIDGDRMHLWDDNPGQHFDASLDRTSHSSGLASSQHKRAHRDRKHEAGETHEAGYENPDNDHGYHHQHDKDYDSNPGM